MEIPKCCVWSKTWKISATVGELCERKDWADKKHDD